MSRRLRIAQVAPISIPLGPDVGGSIEHLVWLLTEELVRRGHSVTLFATGDSKTSAKLRSIYARGSEFEDESWSWELRELMHVASAFEHADEFDVIHSHDYYFALPFTRLVRTAVVQTYHIIPEDDIVRAFARSTSMHLVAISDYQRREFQRALEVPVVHHGIDVSAFPFRKGRGEYLLFLGRIIPEKGPLEAIRIAKQTGMPLVIAGPVVDDYYGAQIAPLVDGRAVKYVGAVEPTRRNRLLAGAAGLLYPVPDAEPFGLVLVEAMACGTPVAALAKGAVPEIVENGRTGYLADDVESLAEYIPKLVQLDRTEVRARALARFNYTRMVNDYEEIYQRALEGQLSRAA